MLIFKHHQLLATDQAEILQRCTNKWTGLSQLGDRGQRFLCLNTRLLPRSRVSSYRKL